MRIEIARMAGEIPDKPLKTQTFAEWDKNSAKSPIAKLEKPFSKPPIKKDIFTALHFTKNSSIFKRTMSEAEIIASKDISPEGEVAHLSHKDKVFRAMHGGSKPEAVKPSVDKFGDNFEDDLDITGLLGEDAPEKKDPERLAEKLGPELGMELHPFRAATEGKEHILLESKDGKKLVKVDKFSADEDIREEKAKTYNVLKELFPDRLPQSDSFNKAGETGVAVDKVDIHPQFKDARNAAKNGDQKIWNEITKSYFSDVMDEADAMGIDLWNSIDADEPDNFVTDKKGNQIFVDDFWIEGKDILSNKDNIINRMKTEPGKYSPTQQTRVMEAITDLEQFTENKNQPKATDKTITRQLEHA